MLHHKGKRKNQKPLCNVEFIRYISAIFIFICVVGSDLSAQIHVLTKLYDFQISSPGNPVAMNPYDKPIQIGNELWFTSENGGTTGFGTLSSFDLSSNTITTRVATMDNTTGNTPVGRLYSSGDNLYYTTSRGGTGDRGTLSRFNIPTSTNAVLYNSPSNTPSTNLYSYHSNVVQIGDSLYWMARSGGPLGVQGGGIMRYNLTTSTSSVLHTFDNVPNGRFPFHGLTAVGSTLYFTTFTGGISGPGSPNGAGTLGSFDTVTNTFTLLAQLPLGAGDRLPGHNPVYDSITNSLYFTTAGTATNPGALMRYDLTLSALTTLHQHSTAPGFPEGRFAYSEPVIFGDSLYYTTIQGGANAGGPNPAAGAGTINRYNLLTNTFEVLFNLGDDGITSWGREARGGLTLGTYNGDDVLFLLTRSGGDFGRGTLLMIQIIPEPQIVLLTLAILGGLIVFQKLSRILLK